MVCFLLLSSPRNLKGRVHVFGHSYVNSPPPHSGLISVRSDFQRSEFFANPHDGPILYAIKKGYVASK